MTQINKISSQYIKSEQINKRVKKLNLQCIHMYRSQFKDGTIRMKYYCVQKVTQECHDQLKLLGLARRTRREYYGISVDYIIHIK